MMGRDIEPDIVIRRGHLNTPRANYEFFGEWQRLNDNNFEPRGVGIARTLDWSVIAGTFDRNGIVHGIPYLYFD